MAKRVTVNISLPPSLKNWLDEQVEHEGFGTASEYVRHLIRRDQNRLSAFVSTREQVEEKIAEALRSPARPMTPKRWAKLTAEAERRLLAARAAQGARRKSA